MNGIADWVLVAATGAVGAFAFKTYTAAKMWVKRATTVEMEVEDREAYKWLAEWLAVEAERDDCKKLSVHEHEVTKVGQPFDPMRSHAVFVPGEGSHVFHYQGRRIWVERAKGKKNGSIIINQEGSFDIAPDTIKLSTFGRDINILKALVLEAELVYRERRSNRLSAWVGTRWGDWNESANLAGRALDTVVLPEGKADKLIVDVRVFLGAEERYRAAGVPYRRGYLFYGVPGCGKSSLAKAIATECGLNLYVAHLGGGLTDDALRRMLDNMRPHSLVLLEDAEAAVADDSEKGVTRSGLLNALDGAMASEGRVLVMTTNHYESLDKALIRPGRVDVEMEMGPADAYQAARMYERFFPSENGNAVHFGQRASGETPAVIQGHLIEHWSSAEDALSGWVAE